MRIPSAARLSVLFLVIFALGACATRGGDVPYNPEGFVAPDPVAPATVTGDYKLSPGDVVTVNVYELETLSGDKTVDATGRVDMPLVGKISADGLTTDQLSSRIGDSLGQKYLQSPHVSVALKQAVARTVTIDGAVKSPGVYAVSNETTLIQAIALASGTANTANPKRIVVFREIDGHRAAAAFDLTTIRRGEESDPHIYPRDTIVVDGSNLSQRYRTLLSSLPLAAFFLRF